MREDVKALTPYVRIIHSTIYGRRINSCCLHFCTFLHTIL